MSKLRNGFSREEVNQIGKTPSSQLYFLKPIFTNEMKKNNIIFKSSAHLLLLVMLYMHICSALCATSAQGCCGKADKHHDHCKKECCKHEKKSDEKTHDCQDMHLSFFSTTGQFSQVKADISLNPFQSLIAVITSLFIIQPTVSKNIFAYSWLYNK